MNEELIQKEVEEKKESREALPLEEKKIQFAYSSTDLIKGFMFSELILPPISMRKKR
jgi:hypothetical protein